MESFTTTQKSADRALRVGVAFAFLYPSIDAWFNPYSWLGYFPGFMRGVVPDMLLLHAFGILEILLALWLLSGRKVYIPAAVCTAMLLAIVGFDISNFEVLFRDLSIAAASFALALIHMPKNKRDIA